MLLAAPSEDEARDIQRTGGFNRPGNAFADVLAVGVEDVRALVERFRAAGASKFVLLPVARDVIPWLERLKAEVVDAVEAP